MTQPASLDWLDRFLAPFSEEKRDQLLMALEAAMARVAARRDEVRRRRKALDAVVRQLPPETLIALEGRFRARRQRLWG